MDLNRGTFYLHYPDTSALLRSMEKELLEEAQALIDAHMAQSQAERSLRPVFEPVLDYVVANRAACKALFADGSGSEFLNRLQELIYRNGIGLAEAWFHPASEEQMDYLMSFVTYGLIGLIKEWFRQEMQLPKEELVAAADRLVQGAAAALLEGGPPRSTV
jgi:AcrR family transcriptional regulator